MCCIQQKLFLAFINLSFASYKPNVRLKYVYLVMAWQAVLPTVKKVYKVQTFWQWVVACMMDVCTHRKWCLMTSLTLHESRWVYANYNIKYSTIAYYGWCNWIHLNLCWIWTHTVPVLSHQQAAHGSLECWSLRIWHCGSTLRLLAPAVSGNYVRSNVFEGHWTKNQSLHFYTALSPIESTIAAAYWRDHPKLLLTGFSEFKCCYMSHHKHSKIWQRLASHHEAWTTLAWHVRAYSVPNCNDSLSLSQWQGSRISIWTVYPSKPEIIKISTSVITEQPTSCSTCKVIHPWTSFVCCCWTYHLEQFTRISAWSWTFNRQFSASVKIFPVCPVLKRIRNFCALGPLRSINLLFTLHCITLHYGERIYFHSILLHSTK